MASTEELIKAIRSGSLSSVRAALDAGASVECDDGRGAPGLPLGIACFMGHAKIVRELLEHGAQVNLADNRNPVSPLAMAIRGGHADVVRLLVELGADVPPDMPTGLSAQELIAAQWQAYHTGKREAPPSSASGEVQEIEEIVMPKAFGVDTTTLNADIVRAAREMEEKRKKEKK